MRLAGVAAALEIGGTHVSSGLVAMDRSLVLPRTMARSDFAPNATRDELLGAIVGAAKRLARADVRRLGVATPGPFDYERGVSRIRGVAKLDALYGVDLRSELSSAVALEPKNVSFLNDASAFLIGEWWAGAARRHDRAIGVTLGTGLGSAFMERGEIVETDPRVPPEGRFDLVPFRGGAVEDVLSSRAVRAAYGDAGADVVEIASRARAGEARATSVFRSFGGALGEFLAPWLGRFEPSSLVMGGSIARSWDLWSDEFRAACAPARELASCGVAEHLDEAALLGAAYDSARRSVYASPLWVNRWRASRG
ncbi:MAG TPA: ROK family protein [Candidatus Limnocylindria bacterium]|nr:ROK family protein [Candidatus Limnocylindria bacterium]